MPQSTCHVPSNRALHFYRDFKSICYIIQIKMARVDRFQYEREWARLGLTRLAGVDEAGRGPLAGPVVAAAVILPEAWYAEGIPEELRELNDSKQLSATDRDQYFGFLTTLSGICFGISEVEASVIDQINILQATHRAMNSALAQLEPPPQHVLVDGLIVKSLVYPQTALVKGDSRSYSIAAASVLAKVTRDRIMIAYDRQYPGYGFCEHKGYPTPAHLEALRRLGPCLIHRRSYAPLKAVQSELF
jgi:ribonuclease HII